MRKGHVDITRQQDVSPVSEPLVRFDINNSRSLINLIPDPIARAVADHMQKAPELFVMDESELKLHLRQTNRSPNYLDNVVRMKFWLEYDRVQGTGEKRMAINPIYGNAMDADLWCKYLKITAKVAWLMCPPSAYVERMQEALSFGVDELRDMLARDHINPNGEVNVRLAGLKLKIVELLDERLNGAAVQHIQQNVNQKTLSVSEHRHIKMEASVATGTSLETRLNILDKFEREATHIPEPKALNEAPEKITIEVKANQLGKTAAMAAEREVEPVSGILVSASHPDLNDPNKNHVKKQGGLVAD